MADEDEACAEPLRKVLDAIEIWNTKAHNRPRYRSIRMLNRSIAIGQVLKRPEFPLYMGAVFSSFIAGDHPFLLPIQKWTPIDEDHSLQFLIFTDSYAERPGLPEPSSAEDRIQLLYCVGRALQHLAACELVHGNVSLDHIFVRRESGRLIAKLADISGRDNADDLAAYLALYRELLGDPPAATLDDVVRSLHASHPLLLEWHDLQCRAFRPLAIPALVSAPYLSPHVLFALLSSDRRRKWKAIRELLSRAKQTRIGSLCAFVALLFEFGIGVDVDGARAYEFYLKAKDAGYECDARLAALRSPDYRDPQVVGQVLALLGVADGAVRAFERCANPLGVAHYGQFLLGSPALAGTGIELLRESAARGCGFAYYALGIWFYEQKQLEEAFVNFEKATELGCPDAPYIAGVIAARLGKEGKDREMFRIAHEEFADPAAEEARMALGWKSQPDSLRPGESGSK
jgi:tetratricopeptide (TPR) repeat protein